jgi:hypothetical protein
MLRRGAESPNLFALLLHTPEASPTLASFPASGSSFFIRMEDLCLRRNLGRLMLSDGAQKWSDSHLFRTASFAGSEPGA